MTGSPVLVRREGAIGRLTLNRPRSLNALTGPMFAALTEALGAWRSDDSVAAVVLDGAGERGLCAGGDVRFLHDDVARGGHTFAAVLAAEYRLNALIAAYPKPYVALMDGVVMGGGVGVSAHGSVRVVTERTVLAMPECSIGYVPDVGGTWLLARTPGELGTHVALAGARLSGADAIACGLADVLVPSRHLPDLLAALTGPGVRGHDPDDGASVRRIVAGFAVEPGPSALLGDRDWIDRCYGAATVTGIVRALRAEGRDDVAGAITGQAPVALVLTLQALRAARSLSLAGALEQEYRLARASVRWPDFTEGVRSRLLDRDGSPRWTPATLDGVTDEVLARFRRGALPLDPPLGLEPAR